MDFSVSLEAMPLVQTDVDMSPFNTLAVAAKAAYFCEVDSEVALTGILNWWKEQQKQREDPLPIMPLGGGSNIVLADDYPGLVIRVLITGRDLIEEDDQWLWIKVGAGENWHSWVEHCMGFHYWGLENLALIPGNVGAAPIQNIGAYGVELCDYFSELSAIEIASGIAVTFDRDACKFGYRDSVFKQRLRDKYIITSVTFKLRQQPKLSYDYPALQGYFEQKQIAEPSAHQLFDAVCDVRASKLPDPKDLPNVGSFFKNPIVTEQQYRSLAQRFEGLVGYPSDNGFKLAAGWLIDNAGWKGYQADSVGVHSKQALVVINSGGSGKQILALAESLRADILERYGVALEIEPRVYGAPYQ
ncbi:MAG: UDP-N-acetylmuramate dehydrogenase [Cellvibrionaceae bacterium]